MTAVALSPADESHVGVLLRETTDREVYRTEVEKFYVSLATFPTSLISLYIKRESPGRVDSQ